MNNQSMLCMAVVAVTMSVASVADAKTLSDDDKETVTAIAKEVRMFSTSLKESGTKSAYKFLFRAVKNCYETTNPLLADGADRNTRLVFEVDGKSVNITLIQAWRECEAARDQLSAYHKQHKDKAAKAKAREKARREALKNTLKGDKKSFYFNNKYDQIVLFGKGGKRLSTAKALQRASLWFEVVNNKDEDGVTWWEMRRHRFKGNKYKGTTESRGRGLNPPSSAFR